MLTLFKTSHAPIRDYPHPSPEELEAMRLKRLYHTSRREYIKLILLQNVSNLNQWLKDSRDLIASVWRQLEARRLSALWERFGSPDCREDYHAVDNSEQYQALRQLRADLRGVIEKEILDISQVAYAALTTDLRLRDEIAALIEKGL